MSPIRLKAYGYLLSAALIWSVASLVIKLTLKEIDPLPFLVYRFAISAVIGIFFFSRIKAIKFKSSSELFMFLFYGLLGVPFALGFLFLGLDKTTVLNLSLITLSSPLLVEAAGVVFFKERLTHKEKIGTFIAFLGTLLTVIKPILDSTEGIGGFSGNLLLLLYLVGDIAAIVLMKKLTRKSYSPSALTHGSFVIGFFVLLPLLFVGENLSNALVQITTMQFPYHLGVWFMAIMSGTVAYIVRAKGQKTIEIGEGALFGYLSPVFSTILAPLLLQEQVTPLFITGAIIIFVGVFVAEYKPHNKN